MSLHSVNMAATHEKVQDYYGKKLQKTEDLKTTACTTSCGGSFPQVIKKALADCHEEVVSKLVLFLFTFDLPSDRPSWKVSGLSVCTPLCYLLASTPIYVQARFVLL